jgi:5-deoxy-glucuronate isomerase
MNSKLLIEPDLTQTEYLRLTPQSAGWQDLHFSAIQLDEGQTWSFNTRAGEMALIVLGGTCDILSSTGEWRGLGQRRDVFHGMPTTLYLSRGTQLTVTARSPRLDFGVGWAPARHDHPARLVRPEEVAVEIRGGGNATRQINKMIPPGFDCERLVVVEVYTPAGNWSSYPPHKHDERRLDAEGRLLEADLEEIYFYKIEKPEGFAYQRIYTADRRLDELILARDSCLVISPEGYHPVVAAHGYNVYYLNILAGSDQSLAASDDPAYAWVKETWKETDPRLPIVRLGME